MVVSHVAKENPEKICLHNLKHGNDGIDHVIFD